MLPHHVSKAEKSMRIQYVALVPWFQVLIYFQIKIYYQIGKILNLIRYCAS